MAAKKRLWMVRRVYNGDDRIFIIQSACQPVIDEHGLLLAVPGDEGQGFTIPEFHAVFPGADLPPVGVRAVKSIQITLAGASRKAKVAQ